MAHEHYWARLERKECLSESAQCFHLEFVVDDGKLSVHAPGNSFPRWRNPAIRAARNRTRAYSIASAPGGNRFDLCVNRVEGGFFSKPVDCRTCGWATASRCRSRMGTSSCGSRSPTPFLMATGTGIAPMRGFAQWLFPADGQAGMDRSDGKEIWLVYGTRYETRNVLSRRSLKRWPHAMPTFTMCPR